MNNFPLALTQPLNPKILNLKPWEKGDDLLRALGSASYDVTYETAAGRGFRFVMDSVQGNGIKEMFTDEKASSWKNEFNSQHNGRKQMLTGEQACRWKKAMNSIEQKGKQEMPTDKKASSWKKDLNLIQQNERKWASFYLKKLNYFNKMGKRTCPRTNKLPAERRQWRQFNKMEERKCSRTDKLRAEKNNELNSTQWKKRNAQVSSWKKATNLIQQNGRKEILTDE